MLYYILRLTINEESKTMVKAIAKSIIIFAGMFFFGIIMAAAAAPMGGVAVIVGLSVGAVSGLIISALVVEII